MEPAKLVLSYPPSPSNDFQIDVVACIDFNYIPHFATMLASILETNGELIGRIFLITPTPKSQGLIRTQRWLAYRFRRKLEVLSLDPNLLQNLPVNGHFKPVIYARLFMADLLPTDLRSVLYLDCDLVVTGQLSDLSSMVNSSEFWDTPLFAVEDQLVGEHLKEYGHGGKGYFNAGFMLVNLEYWRKNNVGSRAIEAARAGFPMLDQDALNLVLDETWKPIDPKYNLMLKTCDAEAVVIHFVSGSKPWHFGNDHPRKNLYDEFRRQTPFFPYFKGRLLAAVVFDSSRRVRRARKRLRRLLISARDATRRLAMANSRK